MNKFGKLGLMAAMTLTTLVGCAKSTSSDVDCPVRIGFVTDTGGIDDKSFNQGSWEGIKRFAEDNNIDSNCIKYMQSSGEADYDPNLSTLAEEGMDLVVAAGYLFEEAMDAASKKFPDTNFFVIDTVVNSPNVLSGTFSAEQSSYLVGMAAALQAKAEGGDTVGFVGGAESELISTFQAGYEQGVKAVDKNMKVMIDYAGAFDKPDTGKTLAEKQINAGAKVIYHAAGGTGSGVISNVVEHAKKGEKVWAIGVDRDQYEDGTYEVKNGDKTETKSAILTSALKKVDEATYQISQQVLDGKFEGGKTVSFDIHNDGVGIPENNPNLSEEILGKLKQAAQDIKDGKIKVDGTKTTIKNGQVG